jgi:MSHA biogenesis protein MshJ
VKKSASLQNLLNWYSSRPLRERALLLVCLLVVLFFIWDALLLSPFEMRKKKALSQASQIRVELTDLTTRQLLVEARKENDPDQENRQLLEQLQGEISRTRKQLEESVVNLISPQEMPGLLKELLVSQRSLKLLSLENQPAESLQISQLVAEKQLGPVLYRHRLQLEVSGEYLAILAYLQQLEKLPRRLVWEELEIETQEYPLARVRLQVYTLSLSKGWIGG